MEQANQFTTILMSYLPNILAALLVLVVGWLAAWAVGTLTRRIINKMSWPKRLAERTAGEEAARSADIGLWTGRAVFGVLMVFVLVAFFQVLQLFAITEPLNRMLNSIFDFLPRVLGAVLLLIVAWAVASVLRVVLTRALGAARIDERLGETGVEEAGRVPLARTIADAVYWLVFLLFLPAILGALALKGLLTPLDAMVNEILGFLPNIATAALILLIGWFVARIVQQIVSNLLAAVGVDRLSDRIDLGRALGSQRLSGVVGLIVHVLILIPVLIAALNALQLEAITQPASNMLNMILAAVPMVFAAAVLLVIAYVVARVVSGLTSRLLEAAGFDRLLSNLGLAIETTTAGNGRTPSQVAGYLVLVAIMLFAAIEALRLVEFEALASLVSQFTVFLGHVLLGLVIFGIGMYLANLAANAIRTSGTGQADRLAMVARVSILVLAAAMGLDQMGVADEIINLAFGLLLGAIAVAVAIAFGMGGRDLAARELERWVGNKGGGGRKSGGSKGSSSS